jgi:hypothetical protein
MTMLTKTKRQREAAPDVEDIKRCARDMMHNSRYVVKATSTEDRTFRSLFGCCAAVALDIWTRLVTMETVPEGGTITYFLWTLLFLKVYGSTEVMLKVAGNPDAKTFRKWVWSFIPPIGNLQPELVSAVWYEESCHQLQRCCCSFASNNNHTTSCHSILVVHLLS